MILEYSPGGANKDTSNGHFQWFGVQNNESSGAQIQKRTPLFAANQGGIICGAIDEPRKSSKAIDMRVIIDFRDKNVVIAHFRDQNEVFI